MGQYIVTTPKNPQYSGKVGGVLFQGGKAFVSEHTINPALGRSADEVAKMLKEDFGYDVQPVNYAPSVVDFTEQVEPPVENVAPVAVVDEAALNAALSHEKPTPRPRVVLPRKNQNKKRDEAGAEEAPEEK
jgi:hypothetical protein